MCNEELKFELSSRQDLILKREGNAMKLQGYQIWTLQ